MLVCANCGEQNPERARFCGNCGAPLAAAAPETRKIVTILFSDVTGPTPLAERLDPEAFRRVMGRYYDVARRVIVRHGGTVEKFVGDAVMAVFGVPQVHEDDALRAVRAASDLVASLGPLNDELDATYGVRLRLRTGVYTGEVAVGAGETFATGDAVNVAARLEQAAAPGEILIGEPTRRLVRDAVELEPVEALSVRGKAEPVVAWRLVRVVADAPAARRFDSPLVGRERELAGLREAYEGARDERACRLCTVVGAAGIGKSRLVREFRASVGDEALVLTGRCIPYGEGITFWPLAGVVQQAAGIGAELSGEEAVARIAALVADDDERDAIADRVAGAIGLRETGADAAEIFWAVRRLLEALARDRPVVVVFDDIHWAEPTFLDLVEHLADRVEGVPLLLLCMARPELRETRPAFAAGRPQATTLPLEPLSEDESRRLIESLQLASRVDVSLRARIAAAAEGNPLFVEEMLAMLEERDGGDANGGGRVAIPPTIHALLAARLDQLEHGERDVVGRASVIGQEFSGGAVAVLAENAAVEPLLGSLVRKELVRPVEQPAARDAFRFRHLLIRDAAYASLPKGLRAELHERYAHYLAQTSGDRLREVEEVVGYHLEEAHRHRLSLAPPNERTRALADEAAAHLERAGIRANGRGDLPAAANLLGRARALRASDDPRSAGLQALLGATLLELGQLEPAERELASAEDAARAAGDRATELSAHVARSVLRAQSDPAFDPAAAAAAAEEAIPELERLGADAAAARAWRVLVIARLMEHRLGALEEAAARSVEGARRAGHVRVEGEAVFWLALALLLGPTPVPEAIARCDDLLARASGPLGRASVQTAVAGLHAMVGAFDEGRRLVRAGRSGFRELGFVLYDQSSAHAEAGVEVHAGDLEAAERVLRAGSAALAAIGETASLGNQYGFRAWLLAKLGHVDEALELADRSREVAAARAAHSFWRRARSLALAKHGDFAEAIPLAHEALGVLAETDDLHGRAEMLENLAEVLALAGDAEQPRTLLAQAAELYEQKGDAVCGARARAAAR